MKKLGLILILIIAFSIIPANAIKIDPEKHLDKVKGYTITVDKEKGDVQLTNDKLDKSIKVKLISYNIPFFSESDGKAKHDYMDNIRTETYLISYGLEYMIILDGPVKTNVFRMNIESDDMDWYYQPPMYEEYEYANETHSWNKDGDILSYRPENIVGSYAIYDGQTKFSHVYRPLVYDSSGNEIWGELDYNQGILSVTVDQNWLDKADYPVYVDPTFGYTSVGGSVENMVVDDIIFSWWTFSGLSGYVNNMTGYFTQNNDDIKLAIYENNGTSKNLVAESVVWTKNANGWHVFDLVTPYFITNGTYALAIWTNEEGGSNPGIQYDAGGIRGKDSTVGIADWPTYPSVLTDTPQAARSYSVYLNYTEVTPSAPVTKNVECHDVSLDQYELLNITIHEPNGITSLNHVDVNVNTTGDSQNFTFRWVRSTSIFSELSDPDNIATLDTATCIENILNATDVILGFNFTITGGQSGPCDVRVYGYDNSGLNSDDLYASVFTFSYFNWNPTADKIDSLFEQFGIIGYFTIITAWIEGISSKFQSSLTRILALVLLQFTVIEQVYTFFTGWATDLFATVLTFSTFYHQIMDGTSPWIQPIYAIGNFWDLIGYDSWAPAVPMLLFIWWLNSMPKRAAQTVGGEFQVFINDINTAIGLISYFVSIFSYVANTIIDYVLRILPGVT